MRKIYFILFMLIVFFPSTITNSNSQNKSHNFDLSTIYPLTQGSNITIAILDSGVDSLYDENIQINVGESYNGIDDDNNGFIDDVRGWNFLEDTNDTYDASFNYHGTSMTSLIIDIAPEAKILPIVYIDQNNSIPSSSFFEINSALNYSYAMGADIIVMAFNFFRSTPSSTLDILSFLYEKNIPVVVSSGNCFDPVSCSYVKFPARNDHVFAIGSINSHGDRSLFSSTGPELDFVAYGEDLPVNTPLGLEFVSGTSFSTALFGGILALYSGLDSDFSMEDMIYYLKTTSLNLGQLNIYGNGLPQPDIVLKTLNDTTSPIISSISSEAFENSFKISLSIIEESGIQSCEFAIKQLNDTNFTTFHPCKSSLTFPIFNKVGNVVFLDINVNEISSFVQVDLKLVDLNNNSYKFVTDFIFNIVEPETTEIEITHSQISSQIIQQNSTQNSFSTGTLELIPKNSNSPNTSNIPFLTLFSFLSVPIYRKYRQKN